MNEIILVFAGDHRQFEHWCIETFGSMSKTPRHVVYISHYEKSLGYREVSIVKTGTWYENEWAQKALDRLASMQSASL